MKNESYVYIWVQPQRLYSLLRIFKSFAHYHMLLITYYMCVLCIHRITHLQIYIIYAYIYIYTVAEVERWEGGQLLHMNNWKNKYFHWFFWFFFLIFFWINVKILSNAPPPSFISSNLILPMVNFLTGSATVHTRQGTRTISHGNSFYKKICYILCNWF